MKKVLYIMATALAWAGCTKEMVQEEMPAGTYTVSFRATLEPDETRANIDANGLFSWRETDEIAAFSKNGQLVKGTITDYGETCSEFTFTLAEGDLLVPGAIAYYPYSIAVSGNQNQVNLPSSYANTNESAQGFPMRAVLTADGDLPFKHLGGFILLKSVGRPSLAVNGMPRIELTAPGIAGRFTVNDSGTLTAGSTSGVITVQTYSAGSDILIPVPSKTYSSGFSVAGKGTDGFTYFKKEKKSSVMVNRKELLRMPAFDPECDEFYLTCNYLGWSNNVTSVRMIRSGSHEFVGATVISDDDNYENRGFKILSGLNLGNWDYAFGGSGLDASSGLARYGSPYKNIGLGWGKGSYIITLKTSATESGEWQYTIRHYSDAWYLGNGLYLKASANNSDWSSTTNVNLTQTAYRNWVGEIVVGSGGSFDAGRTYYWKIFEHNTGETHNWGGTTVTNALYYAEMIENAGWNAEFNLSAGRYTVYFNDAVGRVMFIKQ